MGLTGPLTVLHQESTSCWWFSSSLIVGRTISTLSSYPPTSAHLNLLLHMLHEYNNSFCHSTTTIDVVPSLMVLHEISAFFSGASSDSTCVMDVHLHRTLQRDISYSVSSYLTLISNAFTALKYLASQSSVFLFFLPVRAQAQWLS